MIAWLSLAFGQVQPAAAPATEEVVVYGQLAIDKARDALVREMERLGWRAIDKGDGVITFRTPAAFLGRATFDPGLGTLDFRRPAAGVTLAPTDAPAAPTTPDPGGMPYASTGYSGAGLWLLPATFVGTYLSMLLWLLPAKHKVDPVWHAVRDATDDELAAYRAVVFETNVRARLDRLPSDLDALWDRGVALDGAPGAVPEDQRLAAILDHWASRTATPEGDRVMAAIEAWLHARVEAIPEPLAEAAEAKRPDGRRLPR